MTHRTWKWDTFGAYLDSAYPRHQDGSEEARAREIRERGRRLVDFPHSVLLQVSYPELDVAIRWCWQQFGPSHGPCLQCYSGYPACTKGGNHAHEGVWTTHWLAKTAYDFGYNEWYFVRRADRERFVEYLPELTWGENYPSGSP